MINKLSVYIKLYLYSKENREPFFGLCSVLCVIVGETA